MDRLITDLRNDKSGTHIGLVAENPTIMDVVDDYTTGDAQLCGVILAEVGKVSAEGRDICGLRASECAQLILQLCGNGLFGAVAIEGDLYFITGFLAGDHLCQLGIFVDLFAVDLCDHITFFQPGFTGSTLRIDVDHVHPINVAADAEFLLLRVVQPFRSHADTEVSTLYFTIFHDVPDHFAHEVRRNG